MDEFIHQVTENYFELIPLWSRTPSPLRVWWKGAEVRDPPVPSNSVPKGLPCELTGAVPRHQAPSTVALTMVTMATVDQHRKEKLVSFLSLQEV